jgi:O-antigen/teichoic acid export membrane protein
MERGERRMKVRLFSQAGTSSGVASRRALVRGGALVFAGTAAWQASNFLFNSVSARLLGPTPYGNLAALTGLAFLAGPIFASAQTVATRLTATALAGGDLERVRGLLRFYVRRVALVGGLAALAFALVSGSVARALRVPSTLPVILLGALFMFSPITHAQRGVMLGAQRFARFGASAAAEGATKIAAAVLLLRVVWRNEASAILAIVVASIVSAVLNRAMLRFLPDPAEAVRPITHPYRYAAYTLATFVVLAGLLSSDVLAAHRYLDARTAGVYAAVSLCGKIAFFITSPLAVFLFPLFSEHQDRGLDSRMALVRGLGVVAAGGTVLYGIYSRMPQVLIRPLFGHGFAAAAPHIGMMAVAFALYAVMYLSAMYLLSQRRVAGPAILVPVLLTQVVAFRAFHGTIGQMIWVQIGVFGAASICLVAWALSARPAPGAQRR